MYVYPLMFPVEGVRERQRQALEEVLAARPRFIVGVFLPSSLLEQPDTPRVLRNGLRELVEDSYQLVAATPFQPDGTAGFAQGEGVQKTWARMPLWETTPPWASFVIWQRRSEAERAGDER
jgi:hypothetical protein